MTLTESEILAKSDCIQLSESHDCTQLIEYSNPTNFDGIQYSDSSPALTFFFRVPAMFHVEQNPQTQEDIETSAGVVITIRQSIQEKQLLETDYLPNYMHDKLQRVLMHKTITIDGNTWKRRDPYETNPIRKYNMKRASVLLTKYQSIEKNTP